MKNSGKIGAIVVAVVIVLGLIMGGMCLTRIPAGYVGIVYNVRKGVTGETLSQGWHMVAPTKKVEKYTVGIEQSYLTAGKDGDSSGNDSFEVPSSDGKGLTVDLTFTYRFDADKIADTYTRFKGLNGTSIKDVFIKPNIMSWTKEVTARHSVTQILGEERANLNSELTEYLASKFSNYGIIIESVSLINIDPDDQTREAIQKKVTAQQELELAKIEKETATVQANKDKEVAEIAAETERIKAQADADAYRIKSESITDKLLKKWELDARMQHGWVTIQGADTIVTTDGN